MTDEQKANDASRYVVLDLGDPADPRPIGSFDNEGAAKKEAEEQAAASSGIEIAVYQKIGSAKLEPRVTWKGAAR